MGIAVSEQDMPTGGAPSGRHSVLWAAMPFYLAAMLIVAAVILGGGGAISGYLTDAILQLLAIPILVYAIWRLSLEKLNQSAILAIALCLSLVAIYLIQLVPLPPELRAMMPGYALIVSSFNNAGLEMGWMPISISPRATWLGLSALLPPLSVFFITLLLGYRARRLLSLVIIVFALFSVLLGMLQVAQGQGSPLHFFGSDGLPEATGFFANRNHFSALIYSIILLLFAWLLSHMKNALANSPGNKLEGGSLTVLLVGISLIVVLIGAQMMARSRAGVGLTILALLGAYALNFGRQRTNEIAKMSRKIVIAISALVLVFIFSSQFALYRILDRLDDNIQEHGRVAFSQTTMQAIWSFMPTGSGMGSFVPVYALFEKTADLRAGKFINRAHNDLLEFWLEAGIAALFLMALFAVFYIARTISVWRRSRPGAEAIDQTLARAATIIIGLLIAHSLVDYPLRTGAMASIFAFSCALLIDPPAGVLEVRGRWFDAVLDRLGFSNISRRRHATRQSAGVVSSNPDTADWPPRPEHIPGASKPPQPIEQTQWGKDIQWPSKWGGDKSSDAEG